MIVIWNAVESQPQDGYKIFFIKVLFSSPFGLEEQMLLVRHQHKLWMKFGEFLTVFIYPLGYSYHP